MKKIALFFNSSWILSKKDEDVLPVEDFLGSINKLYKIEVINSSLTDCEFVVKDTTDSEEQIQHQISNFIKEKFALDSTENVVEFEISEFVSEEKVNSNTKSENEEIDVEASEEDKISEILDKINSLIGAEEFKTLAAECVKIAPGLKKHNVVEAFTHQCFLFSINDGNGLTTYLELFAKLLSELNLFKFNEKNSIVEEVLPPQGKDGGDNVFSCVYSHFNRFGSSAGKIICIDISEWMTKVTDKDFRDFLANIDDHMGEHIFVFKVPFVEKEILTGISKGLGDLLFVRDVSFVPFDQSQLTKCAEEALSKRGYTVEPDVWDVFNTRVTEEKIDGRFYGINTVNKVIREMIYRKQLNNAFSNIDDTIIKKSEIIGLASTFSENDKSGMELLDEFIGMETIKKRVEEIVAQIEMSARNKNIGSPCIHMRFVGNPGTGKTTVARVIGKILKEKGILRNGNFFEYSGRDFCGRYVGETAPKTAAMCRDAYGSVLFIDEAYALYHGDSYSNVDYGREAIDTLIAEMENHRSDLVVIMAGYTDEMNTLLKANAGLESRMPYIVEFPNYTREQLFDIFMLMVNKNFSYNVDFELAAKEYFETLEDEVILSKEFSNARFVRNLFERTWGKAVLRAQLNKEDSTVLTKEDFLLASSEKEFRKIMVKQARTVGFI